MSVEALPYQLSSLSSLGEREIMPPGTKAFDEDVLPSTTSKLRKTICSLAIAGAQTPTPPSSSGEETSSSYSYDDELEEQEELNELLESILRVLPEKVEENKAVQLLQCLESFDATNTSIKISSSSMEHLVKTTVSWTSQLVEDYTQTLNSTFTRLSPVVLSSLALAYKLFDSHPTSYAAQLPTIDEQEIRDWLDNSPLDDSLADCSLKWFCLEYQQSTGTALSANLLNICFQKYSLALMDNDFTLRADQEASVRLLLNLTQFWGKLTRDETSSNHLAIRLVVDVLRIITAINQGSAHFPRPLMSWALRALNGLWHSRSFETTSATKEIRDVVVLQALNSLKTAHHQLQLHDCLKSSESYICLWSLLLLGTMSYPLEQELDTPHAHKWKEKFNTKCRPSFQLFIHWATPTSFERLPRLLNCAAVKVLRSIMSGPAPLAALDQSVVPLLCSLRYLGQFFSTFFLSERTLEQVNKALSWASKFELLKTDMASLQAIFSKEQFPGLLGLLVPLPWNWNSDVDTILEGVHSIALNYMTTNGSKTKPKDFWDDFPPLSTQELPETLPRLVFQLCRIGLKPDHALRFAESFFDTELVAREEPFYFVLRQLKDILFPHSPSNSAYTRPQVNSLLREDFLRQSMWDLDHTNVEDKKDFCYRWELLAKQFIYNLPLDINAAGQVNVSWDGIKRTCPLINGWPVNKSESDSHKSDSTANPNPNAIAKSLTQRLPVTEGFVMIYHACGEQELAANGMRAVDRGPHDFGSLARRYFHFQLPAAIKWALKLLPNSQSTRIPKPIVICFLVKLEEAQPIEKCALLPKPPSNPSFAICPWTATIVASRTEDFDAYGGLLHKVDACEALVGPIASNYPHQSLTVSHFEKGMSYPPTGNAIDFAKHNLIELDTSATLSDLLQHKGDVPLQLAAHSKSLTLIRSSQIAAIYFPKDNLNRRCINTVPEASSSSPAAPPSSPGVQPPTSSAKSWSAVASPSSSKAASSE